MRLFRRNFLSSILLGFISYRAINIEKDADNLYRELLHKHQENPYIISKDMVNWPPCVIGLWTRGSRHTIIMGFSNIKGHCSYTTYKDVLGGKIALMLVIRIAEKYKLGLEVGGHFFKE